MAGGAESGADGREVPDGVEADDTGARLTGRELLALQMRACGYAEAQVDYLLEAAGGEAARLLAGAALRLGVRDAAEAIREAAARGLIDGGAEPAPERDRRPYTRYAARWDEAQGAHRIFDSVRGSWAANQPTIAEERVAVLLAETLNQRETLRQQRRWLQEEDRSRDRK